MRICSKCKIEYEQYSKRSNGMCRECKREYDREYHSKRSPEKRRAKMDAQNARRNRTLERLREYKSSKGCANCDENHPATLDFHHQDPTKKEFSIANALTCSFEKLLLEAEKCIILCANCHRKEHARLDAL